MQLQDLLRFHLIRAVATVIDASLQVARACVHPRPSADQSNTTALVQVFEVNLTDVAMDEWNDPEFALDEFIKVLHQVLVPHEVCLPWLRLGLFGLKRLDL